MGTNNKTGSKKKESFNFGGFWFWGRGLAAITILVAFWNPIAGAILFHIFLFLMLGYAFYKSSQPTEEAEDPLTKDPRPDTVDLPNTPN